MKDKPVYLILEDGSAFGGFSFGAEAKTAGEVVFNTGMVGYPESFTDPSYRGQILVLTYPLIGNYGVPADFARELSSGYESTHIHLKGLVVSQYSAYHHHWSAERGLSDLLIEEGIPGIEGIDTRALTKRLRERGTMMGAITADPSDAKFVIPRAHVVSEVSVSEPRFYDAISEISVRGELVEPRRFGKQDSSFDKPVLSEPCSPFDKLRVNGVRVEGLRVNGVRVEGLRVNGVRVEGLRANGRRVEGLRMNGEFFGAAKRRIAVVDCGCKNTIIKSLIRRGLGVVRVPWNFDVTKLDVSGVLFSNGPGDPTDCPATIETARKVIEAGIPAFGICLGNQMLALASDAVTYKLKFGHRGQNQPCIMAGTNRCFITSQNHGYAVDEKTLPDGLEPWFINANDGTNEGLRHRTKPIMSVQFHPEAMPGPVDTGFLFDEFVAMLK